MKIIKLPKVLFGFLMFEHITLPIRVLIVYEIIRYFYIGDDFDLGKEFNTALTYLLIFILIYVLTTVLDIKRANSSPLFLSDYIEKVVKEDFRISRLLVSKDNRGVYTHSQSVVGIEVKNIFVLHDNPIQVNEVTISYIRILEGMQLPSHDETIKWLENLRDEAQYMIYGK